MTTVTVKDVMAAAETLSLEDRRVLNEWLVRGIRAEHDRLSRQKSLEFKLGDTVKFPSRKGYTITGKIVGFATKNIKVDSNQDRFGYPTGHTIHWTVSPNLLTKVA